MLEGGRKPKVLIVDDTPENVDVLAGILHEHFQIKVALDGAKALKLAQADPPPDLGRIGENAAIARDQVMRCRSITQHFLRMSRGQTSTGDVVDLLARDSDLVCRYNGGPNAGHTIVADGETYKLKHIPSGILQGKECVIGAGCVVGAHSELKRAILLDGAHAPHQNYVGDSVIGERCTSARARRSRTSGSTRQTSGSCSAGPRWTRACGSSGSSWGTT